METIVDVSGEQARLAALQFMGQQMGSLKEIDKTIISRSANLQGISINPEQIIRSVPGPALGIQNTLLNNNAQQPSSPYLNFTVQSEPQPFMPPAPSNQSLALGNNAQPQIPLQQPLPKTVDKDQLEFDFSYDIAKDIVERLERVEKQNKLILEAVLALSKTGLPIKKT